MLIVDLEQMAIDTGGHRKPTGGWGHCTGGCSTTYPPDIIMTGYAEEIGETTADIRLCYRCAIQLSRMLLEDLAALIGGGRNGHDS